LLSLKNFTVPMVIMDNPSLAGRMPARFLLGAEKEGKGAAKRL
jgi:hypothetical protein